ncbi:hypothetical protein ABT063_23720 [Streptomyces sp. NPDC002838]|uniref:hypothetical protein n=1 Tax=Streptomyces sp. NPDC002838 TaxID=3154436 RepID=UPI00332D9C68
MGSNRTTWLARAAALAAGALLAGAAAQGTAYASDGNVDPNTAAAAPAGQQEGDSADGFQDGSTDGQDGSSAEGFNGTGAATQSFQQGG